MNAHHSFFLSLFLSLSLSVSVSFPTECPYCLFSPCRLVHHFSLLRSTFTHTHTHTHTGTIDVKGYSNDCPSWVVLQDTGSSTMIGGGDQPPNIISNGDASGAAPYRGYGNPSQLYCNPAEPSGCAHAAIGRNNWPRGLHQSLDVTNFNGADTGEYEVSFKVKLLQEVSLFDAVNPTEVSYDCTNNKGRHCPTVRFQIRKADDSLQWFTYPPTTIDWKMDGYSDWKLIFPVPAEWVNLKSIIVVFCGGPGGSVLVVDDIYIGSYLPPTLLPGPVDQIVVSPEAAACWNRPGAEILISTSTYEPDQEQVAIIDSVDTTTGVITMTEPLRMVDTISTMANDPRHATEVALLSRKIVFEAEEDPTNADIGGHFMVFHTKQSYQHIQGVEIRNFGQQGRLGKYPMHFHVCEDTVSSVVKKVVV